METIVNLWARALRVVKRLEFVGPLLMRVCIGVLFAQSGWGKLHNIERTTQFFASLHIPAPGVQAVFVALVELVGGVLLLAGLGTRIAAVFLSGTMVVALLTAVEYEGFAGFLTANETIYLVALWWLALAGAGKASVDALIANRFSNKLAKTSEDEAVRVRHAHAG
ncbi:MAG: DoxX family protein [Deltaproteobacteria bacterium]|nr:DoxX family protein [Deltaproteobacteria bacterium]